MVRQPSAADNRNIRRLATGATVTAAGLGGLALILLSPLALSWLDTLAGVNWSRLSEIGQTYGAASAILATLAFGGVAVSVFLQAQQIKTSFCSLWRVGA
jgi:hypothetical protein